MNRIVLLAGSSLFALYIMQPASAQTGTGKSASQADDTGSQNGGLQEIVVTAQKRSENIQRVPISITALSASTLEEKSLDSLAGISNLIPSVTLDASAPFSGSSQVLGATIRGVGQQDFAMNVDPGVGVYLDGVYLARTVGANLDLPDVQRIEVLKGPQGTLFGRNTIGGAISVVTRDPGNEFKGSGDVTIGAYNRMDVKASFDIPLTDQLLSSLTYSRKYQDGWQKRVPFDAGTPINSDPPEAVLSTGTQTADRQGGDNEWTLRGKLLWEPTDRIQNRFSIDYTDVDSEATADSLLGVFDAPGGGSLASIYNACISLPPAVLASPQVGLGTICGPRGTPLAPSRILPPLAGLNVDGNPYNNRLLFNDQFVTNDPNVSYATGANFDTMISYGFANVTDFTLGDDLSLKSITSYRNLDWRTGMDGDASPVQMTELGFSLKQWQASQEFQVIGDALDRKLKYVGGAYAFKEQGFMNDFVDFADGLLQIQGPNHLSTSNYAFFGQGDYRLNNLFGFTLGGRYTKENKIFNGGQTDWNGFYYKLANGGALGPLAEAACTPLVYGGACATAVGIPDPGQPLRFYPAANQYKSFSNFSPKAGVQFYPSDDTMTYVSWSKGYKTGGWTTRLTAPNGSQVAPTFGPETITTTEIGIKNTLLNQRLKLNFDAYYSRYEQIQLNLQVGVSPTIRNAGDADIKGVEVEAVGVVTDALTVSLSGAYTDAKYTQVDPGFVIAPSVLQAGVYVGAPLPKTPEFKVNLGPRYEVGLKSGAAIVLLVDYTYTSSIWNDSERTYLLRRPATNILNPSVMYRDVKNKWNFTVGATNITNQRYVETGLAQLSVGPVYGTYNPPGQWYAKFGYRF